MCQYSVTCYVIMMVMATLDGRGGWYLASLYNTCIQIHAY